MNSPIQKFTWSELESFYQQDQLFFVDTSISFENLIDTLENDHTTALEEWIENGLIVCPLPEEIKYISSQEDATLEGIIIEKMAFIFIEI